MTKFLILLLFFSGIAPAVFAQGNGITSLLFENDSRKADYALRSWTKEDGLPVNSINHIVQSDDGYLWITSYDGLVRFDGYNFTVYHTANTPEITHNRFIHAFKDGRGGLWFSFEFGGVLHYNDSEFTLFNRENGFTDGILTDIPLTLENGNILFPTSNGLFHYDFIAFNRVSIRESGHLNRVIRLATAPGRIYAASGNAIIAIDQNLRDYTIYEYGENTPENEILYLGIDFNGTPIGATETTFVIPVTGDNLGKYTRFPELDSGEVENIFHDDHALILANEFGFIYRKKEGHFRYFNRDDINDSTVRNMFTDSKQNTWIISKKGELFKIINNSIRSFNSGINSSDIYYKNLFSDTQNNIWATTDHGGLIRIFKPVIRSINNRFGIAGNNILGVFEDSRNNIWIGTRDSGITVISGNGELQQYNNEMGFPGDIIYSFAEDHQQNIWAGVYQHGLVRFNRDFEVESRYSLGDYTTINDIRSIVANPDGSLWVGTMDGLILFKNGEIQRHYTTLDGLPSNFIYAIQPDFSGNMWIATAGGGISYFSRNSFKNYDHSDGLKSAFIRGIYIDRDDPEMIWFATEGMGLIRFHEGKFRHITTENGLSDNLLHFVGQDSRGNLWMSSNRGIFYLDKEEAVEFLNGETDHVNTIVFNQFDGLESTEANGGFQNSGHFTASGDLLIPTQAGVAFIQPSLVRSDLDPPVVKIESIESNDVIISGNTNSIKLESGNNDLTIRYTGFEYSAPDRIRFRYKLEGYDRDWIEAGSARSASYNNLRPKKYTFRVQASNAAGVWNDVPASTTITISPFFYQRWWFQALIILAIIAGIVFAHRVRVKSLKKRESRLREEVLIRTKDLQTEKDAAENQKRIIQKQARELAQMNQTKDKFFSIIAHDLKGPFQSILGFTRLLDEQYNQLGEEELRSYLRLVNQSSENVFKLLQNLLSWASIQNKSVNAVLESIDAEAAVYRALKIMTPSASEKGVDIITECEKHLTIRADVNMLDTIIRNLISNAVKFSFPRGIVKVRTSQPDKMVCIEVIDRGTGMSREDLDNLFKIDSHFTRKGTANESGTGLGLVLCKELVEIQGGKLEVQSEDGIGTTFYVYLPASVNEPTKRSPFIKSANVDSES